MALATCTDLGTTARKALTPTQRLKLFEAHRGQCALCGGKIQAGDRWIVEHLRALSLAGTNEPTNLAPVHEACANDKTRGPSGDLAQAAKAKRIKRRHVGITAPKRPIQSPGFALAAPQHRASKPLAKQPAPRNRSLYSPEDGTHVR